MLYFFFTLTNRWEPCLYFWLMTKGNGWWRTASYCETCYYHFLYYTSGFYFFRAIFIQILWNIDQWLSYCCRFYYFEDWVWYVAARFTNTKLKDEEIKTYANDISITPLSIPMLCGPGAIANGIMLMDDANTWTMKGILIGIIGLIYFITYLILRASTRLVSILGETGNNVMMRLMGLILMVIAVERFVSGFRSDINWYYPIK